jgi:hypothetical protein
MNPVSSVVLESEIALAKEFIARGELSIDFGHIERTQVIGQAFVPRAKSH